MPRPSRPRRPDVEIRARAQAKEIVFHETPDVHDHAVTEPSGESDSGSDREGLPRRVRPHVRYRDIRIDYRLAARLSGERLTPPTGE